MQFIRIKNNISWMMSKTPLALLIKGLENGYKTRVTLYNTLYNNKISIFLTTDIITISSSVSVFLNEIGIA